MDHTIVNKIFTATNEVNDFLNKIRLNGWNLHNAFIHITVADRYFVVFYEKYLDEPMKRGQNL